MLAVLGLVLFSGKSRNPGASSDLAALRAVVQLPSAFTAGRWEIFGTPEHTGGAPGPTDYVTLVAELRIAPGDWRRLEAADGGKPFVAPEAARMWLSTPYRTLLAKHKGGEFELQSAQDCRAWSSKVVKSGRQVSGFTCLNGDHALVYLTLMAPGAS
ncbi:hypothetical protein HH212_19970 [Massilia forsythiae]|uniref:Uncharacterized protein n=1 Tax=Massilia forsythiae TaxID=2728020 RepID=A0A7Z2VZC1_9BURK|nr:hypothetical protein [Massilia forsythiae]QJE02014.1 hypothetical protein HH212_19970 [Massilia forsythiae]